MELSTDMEVTVGGMDAAVEPSGMSSWRVTGMTVLNHFKVLTYFRTRQHYAQKQIQSTPTFDCGLTS
ncbi:hypothetical protein CF168_00715 [Shewanella bicestrii]|uniref:Uncharacterized protein n=1 Tax=Shewanella bicestrii TaxID=2018305 RepID=A0A220UIH0_9GAMM|nr:hypothetical protein CF168_00715 [Shewanella bicestrii]